MYALTLHQPWATLVIYGWKTVETRSWSTRFRGALAIHASMVMPDRGICYEWPYRDILRELEIDDLPVGCVLGVVRLADCRPTYQITDADLPERYVGSLQFLVDRSVGDFSSNRFGWFLKDPQPFETPVPARGLQRLWKWAPPTADAYDLAPPSLTGNNGESGVDEWPRNQHELKAAGYKGQYYKTCDGDGCDKRILMVKTPNNALQPLEEVPRPLGSEPEEGKWFYPHHATCPDRKRFKRRKKKVRKT